MNNLSIQLFFVYSRVGKVAYLVAKNLILLPIEGYNLILTNKRVYLLKLWCKQIFSISLKKNKHKKHKYIKSILGLVPTKALKTCFN